MGDIVTRILKEKEQEAKDKILERYNKSNEEINKSYLDDSDDDFEIENKKERKKIFRRFKPYIIKFVISMLVLGGSNVISYNIGKQKGTEQTTESMKENYLHTCNLSNAPDKIIIEWANEAFGQYSNDMINCGIENANERIESFRDSYFQPVMKSYNDYIETNDIEINEIDEYNDFKMNVYNLEKNLNASPIGKDYSFDSSVFSYAVLVDAENNIVNKDDGNTRIFIAEDFYDETSETVTFKEGSIMKDGKIYYPYNPSEHKINYSK